jgi:putative ABC transport system permease protein
LGALLYSLLLKLLPRARRERDGAEMAATFAMLRDDTRRGRRRALAVSALWVRETRGLLSVSVRDRAPRLASFVRGLRSFVPGGGNFRQELKWAWRGVRARGARGWLVAGLLAVAIAANTLVFAVADSVVFNRVPYPRAEEIVEIRSSYGAEGRNDRFLSASLLDAWRRQTDLFVSVQAYLTKTVFVVANGRSEIMPAVDVTPGLIELLRVRPSWGRSFTADDARDTTKIPALISADLARELYGDPRSAVGRPLETTAYPLVVVGVMPDSFVFPRGAYKIWRVFDPRGPLAQGFGGVQSIARTVPGLPLAKLDEAIRARSPGVREAAGARAGYLASAGEFYVLASDPRSRATFWLLLGAAVCLLLTACANVASLELAGALHRQRIAAVQIALGASRASLIRGALFEAILVVGGASIFGASLGWLLIGGLVAYLPESFGTQGANPIDLDRRGLVFMAGVAAAVWLLTSLPAVFSAFRVQVAPLLKSDDRHGAGSHGGGRMRRALTMLEIAIAIVLVIGGLAYTRSYLALLRVDKGFDSRNLAGVSFAIPVEYYAGPGEMADLRNRAIVQLRALPGVTAVARASPPPSMNNSPFGGVRIERDGALVNGSFTIGESSIYPEYFSVIGLTIRQGRWFGDNEPPTSAIVTQEFARRFWPEGEAVGRTFRRIVTGGREQPRLDVIGVVDNFRDGRPDAINKTEPAYYYYTAIQPPPPPAPAAPVSAARSTGGSWRFLTFTVRLDSLDRRDAVLAAARSVDPRLRVTFTSVEETYADMFSDVLLATRVTSAFGIAAFLVAAIGLYGVLSYLIVARQREIGIRIALGADRRDINRLVLGSSLRLVLAGAALGLVAAATLSRYLQAQLYQVSALDPGIYTVVTLAVIAVALLATWQPARSAARVDPASTLRSE